MIRILELRDLARTEPGDRYDTREFHNVLLTSGSVPLGILEYLAKQYMEKRACHHLEHDS